MSECVCRTNKFSKLWLLNFQVNLAEALTAYEQAKALNAQMEKEKSDLTYHVHKLKGTVKQLEEILYERDITCGVIKQASESAFHMGAVF